MRKFTEPILCALLLSLPAAASLAADHDRGREEHGRGHVEAWHGDIHRFHEHDMGRWRGGHWIHARHAGRLGWWWIVGTTWYFYPAPVYPYPDPYLPPTVTPPPPAAVPAAPGYWYYCRSPSGYYPYVAQCNEQWQRVQATPP